MRLRVRRGIDMLGDAVTQLKAMDSHQVTRKLVIEFDGEPGIDAGGLFKDFCEVRVGCSLAIVTQPHVRHVAARPAQTDEPVQLHACS